MSGWWQERRLNILDDSNGRHLYFCRWPALGSSTWTWTGIWTGIWIWIWILTERPLIKQFTTRKTAMVSIQFGQRPAAL
jgi:hypothetical protein